jgi:hypothetical protein
MTLETRWNKKGQFEHEVIRDKLTKPFLASIGCDPMGQDPLPGTFANMIEPNWRNRVLKVIKEEGYDGAGRWFFKGAKSCLIWPVWHKAFPKADWVVVRRKDENIINSCMKTSFMKKRKTRESWQEWIDHHKACWSAMVTAGLSVREIWPGETVDGNGALGPLKALVWSLGLDWDDDRVRDFVTKELWTGG